MKKNLFFAFLIWAIAKTCLATVTVTANEKWSNVFFGEETIFTFSVSGDKPFIGNAGWRFSIGGRTITQGEKAIEVLPGRSQSLVVPVPVPEGKEGVAFSGLVAVSVYDVKNRIVVAKHDKEIRIFSKNPFLSKQHWLSGLNLALFDPEKRTAQILTKSKIQYKEVYNREVLPDIRNGVVLIGEGISLSDYPGLAGMLIELTASGIPVICLAPTEGAIPIGDVMIDNHAPSPSGMLFMQNKIIRQLDKTLDMHSWPPDGQLVKSCLLLKKDKSEIAANVNKNNKGWPWLEIQYQNPEGRLIVCGFAIIEKWDSGPAPRHLFLRLLEYVDGKSGNA